MAAIQSDFPKGGHIARRYRGESNIVFDMDPPDRRAIPLTKQKKNADFAAKIEREGFPEMYKSPYYGIGHGPRFRATVDTTASRSQLGGGARCEIVGFNGEFREQNLGTGLRWEVINDDFLGEHRPVMSPYKPKFRAVEGYTPHAHEFAAEAETEVMGGGPLHQHQSQQQSRGSVFAAPGDAYYADYSHLAHPPLYAGDESHQSKKNAHGDDNKRGYEGHMEDDDGEEADSAQPHHPHNPLAYAIATDVAAEFSHATPKSDFYSWEAPNFRGSTAHQQQQRSGGQPSATPRRVVNGGGVEASGNGPFASPHPAAFFGGGHTPPSSLVRGGGRGGTPRRAAGSTSQSYQSPLPIGASASAASGDAYGNSYVDPITGRRRAGTPQRYQQQQQMGLSPSTAAERPHRHLSAYQDSFGAPSARSGVAGGLPSAVGNTAELDEKRREANAARRSNTPARTYGVAAPMDQQSDIPHSAAAAAFGGGGRRSTTPSHRGYSQFSAGVTFSSPPAASAAAAAVPTTPPNFYGNSYVDPVSGRRRAGTPTPQRAAGAPSYRSNRAEPSVTPGGGVRAASSSPARDDGDDVNDVDASSIYGGGATGDAVSSLEGRVAAAEARYQEQYAQLLAAQAARHAALQAAIGGASSPMPAAAAGGPTSTVSPPRRRARSAAAGGGGGSSASPAANARFGSTPRHHAGANASSSQTPIRVSRKMVPNTPTSNSYRVLHTSLQEPPAPFRPSLRTGLAPTPELERDPDSFPRERLSDIFNYRYTGR